MAAQSTSDSGRGQAPFLAQVPAGFAAIPVGAGELAASIRLCVLARLKAHPVAGHLVPIREGIDSRVVLGCIADRAGRVHRWLEIHIQTLDGLHAAGPVLREPLSNKTLDDRWRAAFEALARASDGGALTTGAETAHPYPTFLDLDAKKPIHPADDQGRPWELCRDEAVLSQAGLPGYSSSVHRYLFIRGAESKLVPVTPDAPTNERTEPMGAVVDPMLVPFNPGGGLMMVRPRGEAGYEAYADLLGAEPAKAVLRAGPLPETDPAAQEQGVVRPMADAGLMLSRHGRLGRIVETFHLKLRLLADAVGAVRTMTERLQAPLLNLSPESFRVELGAPGAGLPALWTARAVLAAPGGAVALSIPGAEAEYYLRPPQSGASVYSPDSAGRAVQGRASIRIRKVEPAQRSGAAIVSGTFSTQERVRPTSSDMVWVRLHIGQGRVDLYGRLESDSGLGPGEWRFRTVPQAFGDPGVSALKAAEGVPMPDAPFQVIPLLSTPCDLYSLAVLAVRTLLVAGGATLAESLDELMSLARQVDEGEGELPDRLRAAFEGEPRWSRTLGPDKVAEGVANPEEALDLIPLDLWCGTLAAIIRMFPGHTSHSSSRDLGDAPPAGLHTVFDTAASDLNDLLVRTRSLIVIDWRLNREVHAVIRGYRTGLAPGRA